MKFAGWSWDEYLRTPVRHAEAMRVMLREVIVAREAAEE